MNVKYLVSYLGLLPFLCLIIDGYYLEILDVNFIWDLSLLMSCIIFTFIGAYNWNFVIDRPWLEFYGFMPSLISMVILTLSLLGISKIILLIVVIVFLVTQLFFDLILSLKDIFPMRYFMTLRIPVTSGLTISLFLISLIS
jgi:hypothetical protein|tara:strand:- start:1169 stop:1591 length:423 start_codon:yes stop_codon:yes gene_type:complete